MSPAHLILSSIVFIVSPQPLHLSPPSSLHHPLCPAAEYWWLSLHASSCAGMSRWHCCVSSSSFLLTDADQTGACRIKELEQSLLFEKTKADKLQRELEDTRVMVSLLWRSMVVDDGHRGWRAPQLAYSRDPAVRLESTGPGTSGPHGCRLRVGPGACVRTLCPRWRFIPLVSPAKLII